MKYVFATLTEESAIAIADWCDLMSVPNPVPPGELHVTILQTLDPMDGFTSIGPLPYLVEAQVNTPTVWETSEKKRCLVLPLLAAPVVDRHTMLSERYGSSSVFTKYIPHITISYDLGNVDVSKLLRYQMSKIGLDKVTIGGEYVEAMRKAPYTETGEPITNYTLSEFEMWWNNIPEEEPHAIETPTTQT
jgi:hypothetical protein